MARRFSGGRLVIATHNRGKLREIEALLRPFGAAVTGAGALGLPEPEETGTSFEANAELKALAAAAAAVFKKSRRVTSDSFPILIFATSSMFYQENGPSPLNRTQLMARQKGHAVT